MKNHLISFLVLAAGFLLTQLSTMLLIPALPGLVSIFHTTSSTMMLTISVFFTGYMIGQLVWGSASDYIGRKAALVISLILYIGTSLFMTRLSSILIFEAMYLLLGFAAAAYTSVGNACLKDIYGKEKVAKAIAYTGIVMASGSLIGPAIGSQLATWFNWQAVFIGLAALATIIMIALIIFVPETNHAHKQQQKTSLKTAYKSVLTNKNFMIYVLTLGIAFGCLFAYFAVSAFIFTDYLNFSVTQFGWINIITAATYVLAASLIVRFVKQHGVQKLTKIGVNIGAISTVVLLIVAVTGIKSSVLLILPIIGLMFGFGLVLPATKAGAMTSVHENAGTAASLMKFIQTLFCVVIVAIAARLHASVNLVPFAVLLLGLSLAAVFIFSRLTKQEELGQDVSLI